MQIANRKSRLLRRIGRHYELYLFLLPAVIYLILMCYVPMAGVLIAFKNYKPRAGIFGSEWVGMKHFIRLFNMANFGRYMKNTVTLSLYSLLAGFPLPVLLALAINTSPYRRLNKVVQLITYAPHFISVVVIVSMVNVFFSPTTGVIFGILNRLNLIEGSLDILLKPQSFPHLYVWTGVWQEIGWGSIIYLGALSGVDSDLHEAALIDGANRWQRVLHIDIPAIVPTIIIMFILRSGSIMNVGFEKVFLMQNSANISTSEVLSTYTYSAGIKDGQYSFAAAMGLFNSLVNFCIVMLVNYISGRVSETSLW